MFSFKTLLSIPSSIKIKCLYFRILVQNHREKLIRELENCEEPALVLHLVVLALFTILNQNMLHASGRQVPIIITFLKSQLKEGHFEKLQKYHGKEVCFRIKIINNHRKNTHPITCSIKIALNAKNL